MSCTFVKKFIDIKEKQGAKVYAIGVQLPDGFKEYPRLVNVSPALSRRCVTNEALQTEILSTRYVRDFPDDIDIAVLGTHEDYFVAHIGRLFSERVRYVVFPKKLYDKYGYVFNKLYYEDVYDDGHFMVMKLVK